MALSVARQRVRRFLTSTCQVQRPATPAARDVRGGINTSPAYVTETTCPCAVALYPRPFTPGSGSADEQLDIRRAIVFVPVGTPVAEDRQLVVDGAETFKIEQVWPQATWGAVQRVLVLRVGQSPTTT